jgi:L-alanine-DL-glutamate epimerase-like enolase superfamily enzyme
VRHQRWPGITDNADLFQLCIDANGAWNPEGCIEMLKVLKPLSDHIYMLEQPFPTTLLKVTTEPPL